ncbi:hypothetical protein GYMLUDRAFT_86769 [Collybiopsis luxurians FD-317 M1]|uniref:RRM domain-containing protein n=1 Tax=Collybiopsis luxurians FD-317 M1 TaxID=944289 RepID=A0A0D0CQA0_9AGAR|nr:hypothetical protein GYMLUDRAFT_86769 [Collybiopsis luxurians FD-317 M1]
MRILFVSGFSANTRARELAYEFESAFDPLYLERDLLTQCNLFLFRFGPLIRCDVPAPRHSHSRTAPYAFVEFQSGRDAEEAYRDMHGRHFDGYRLSVQWARRPPSSAWRFDGSAPPSRSDRESRARSRSPRRREDDRIRRDRDPDSREKRRDRSRSRDRGGARTPPLPPTTAEDDVRDDSRENGRDYEDSRDDRGDVKDRRESPGHYREESARDRRRNDDRD